MRQADTGVVLAHGKWDRRPFAIDALATPLATAGYASATPELPWSLHRLYDASFDTALDELHAAVAGLRDAGCHRVLLAGHSLGANAAVACAARGTRIDGLVVLAPGHLPERLHAEGVTTAALQDARAALAAGERSRRVLVDSFQGVPRRLRIDPAHYLAYFDPAGAAVLPANCARLPEMPVLWMVGRADPHAALGPAYAYDRVPRHPLSRYVEIDADHIGTPAAAAPLVLQWLQRHFH